MSRRKYHITGNKKANIKNEQTYREQKNVIEKERTIEE